MFAVPKALKMYPLKFAYIKYMIFDRCFTLLEMYLFLLASSFEVLVVLNERGKSIGLLILDVCKY